MQVTEDVILYGATLFLGFVLGCLLSADVFTDPKMFKLIILGFIALFLSGVGGLIGGYIAYFLSGEKTQPAAWHCRRFLCSHYGKGCA